MSVPWYLMAKGKGGGGYKTASGPIVSVNDALAAPLRSLVANIEPVQDLHGYDSPWPAGGGKNKWPHEDPDYTASKNYTFETPIMFANQTYTISATLDIDNPNYTSALIFYGEAGDGYLGNWYFNEGVTSKTVTPTADIYKLSFYATISGATNPGVTAKWTNFQIELGSASTAYAPYSNICPISGWSAVNVWVEPTYDPTANPTATIQLGDTVYGGTLDMTNGVLTVDRAYWTKNTSTMDNANAYPGWKNAGLKALGYSGSSVVRNAVMNIGTVFSFNCVGNNDVLFLSTAFYDKTQEEWIALAMDVQILVPLATPITIPLTPTQISTLQGQNNVWADTGDVTVEYLSSGGTDPDLMKLAVAFMGKGVK